MKWQNFANFAAQNLGLSTCLHELVAPTLLHGNGYNPQFESWVERHVDFVVVRPFESLNMGAMDSESTDVENYTTRVVYGVWHHIQGEEQPCSRLRYLYSDGPSTTITRLINGLVTWHAEYWALQPDRPLVIDVIVRHVKKSHPDMDGYRESVEFFIVPAVLQLQS
jgi:hypothetical protein